MFLFYLWHKLGTLHYLTVLVSPISEALQNLSSDIPVPPAIHQMLLILQGIHDRPVTENTILLERLVARVVSPYLGMLGLYNGGTEPEVRSNYKVPSRLPSPVICKWQTPAGLFNGRTHIKKEKKNIFFCFLFYSFSWNIGNKTPSSDSDVRIFKKKKNYYYLLIGSWKLFFATGLIVTAMTTIVDKLVKSSIRRDHENEKRN